jgi:mannitol/fructose-specific phosphotransferase system IIA component (Ntr-type)
MPHRIFNTEEVAKYLHLTLADVERLLKDDAIPHEVRGQRPVFRKRDIDAWASQRILGLQDRRLAEYHQKSSHGMRAVLPNDAIMPEMIQPGFIDASMAAKTNASVLREMVALAERTGLVFEPRDLLASIEAREEICPTAIPGGLALLHPRHHQPYMFEASFIVLGRPVQEIHFGAPDGKSTDLFFLICCQDDRIHLHALARLCMMAQKTELLSQLRAAPDATAMHDYILLAEAEVLKGKKPSAS